MTQLSYAKEGKITKEMEYVASVENIEPHILRQNIAQGSVIIPANINHKNLKPVAIGKGVKTKVNANIGASKVRACVEEELEKIRLCIKYGADTVMDLSTGGNLNEIRKAIINESVIPIGTVPTYQVIDQHQTIDDLKADDWLDVIEQQAKQGVDYMTIHAGVLQKTLPLLKDRLTGVVSRGGAILVRWMKVNNKENPLYTHFQIFQIYNENLF